MAISRNITATYRGPSRVMNAMLALGPREDRALAYLMAGCAIVFIAQLPRLAREAHLTGDDLNMKMGATLLVWVFVMPLVFYALAGVSHLLARVFGGRGTSYGARLALFWALLATSPIMLLNGLVAGFIGPGVQLQLVGIVWFAAFLWIWIGGLVAAERSTQ